GNDISWTNNDVNTTGWIRLNPTQLSAKYADKTGKVEGWFSLRIKLDTDFQNVPIGIRRGSWAATDIFIDGKLLASFGNTGAHGQPYKEFNSIDKLSVPVNMEPGKEHSIVMHFVDYLSPFPPRKLKSQALGGLSTRASVRGFRLFLLLTGPNYNATVQD